MKLIFLTTGLNKVKTKCQKSKLRMKLSYGHKVDEKVEKFDDIKSKQRNQSNHSRRLHQTFYVKSPTIYENNRKQPNRLQKKRKPSVVEQQNTCNIYPDQIADKKKALVITSHTPDKGISDVKLEDVAIEKDIVSDDFMDTTCSSQTSLMPYENEPPLVLDPHSKVLSSSSEEISYRNAKHHSSTTCTTRARKSILAFPTCKEENSEFKISEEEIAKYRNLRKFSVRNSMRDLGHSFQMIDYESSRSKIEQKANKARNVYDKKLGYNDDTGSTCSSDSVGECNNQGYSRKFSVRNSMYDVQNESLESDKSSKALKVPSKTDRNTRDTDVDDGDYDFKDFTVSSTSTEQETNAQRQSYLKRFSVRNSIYDVQNESLESDSSSKALKVPDKTEQQTGDTKANYKFKDFEMSRTSTEQETIAERQSYYRKFSVRNSMFDVINESLESDSNSKELKVPDNMQCKDSADIKKSNKLEQYSVSSSNSTSELMAERQSYYRKFSIRNSMCDVQNESFESDSKSNDSRVSDKIKWPSDTAEVENSRVRSSIDSKSSSEADMVAQRQSYYRKFSIRNSMCDVQNESFESDSKSNDSRKVPDKIRWTSDTTEVESGRIKDTTVSYSTSETETLAQRQSYFRKFSIRNSMNDVQSESFESDEKETEDRRRPKDERESSDINPQKNSSLDIQRPIRRSEKSFDINKTQKQHFQLSSSTKLFNYSTKSEENYIMNYSKRLSIARKESKAACINYTFKTPKQDNFLDIANDNMKRLIRFHLPLSFYHGIEED